MEFNAAVGKLCELDPTELHLAKSLWKLDPMGTCCHVNQGMDDEYWQEAQMIMALSRHGVQIASAIQQTFDHSFWPGALGADFTSAVMACFNGEGIATVASARKP